MFNFTVRRVDFLRLRIDLADNHHNLDLNLLRLITASNKRQIWIILFAFNESRSWISSRSDELRARLGRQFSVLQFIRRFSDIFSRCVVERQTSSATRFRCRTQLFVSVFVADLRRVFVVSESLDISLRWTEIWISFFVFVRFCDSSWCFFFLFLGRRL